LQISDVESVEALSDIISSKSVNVCDSIDSRVLRRDQSPLYTGNPILMIGFLYSAMGTTPKNSIYLNILDI